MPLSWAALPAAFSGAPSKPRHSLAGKRKSLVLFRKPPEPAPRLRRLPPWELKQRARRLEQRARNASKDRRERLLDRAKLYRTLAESNAIIRYLARGSDLIPGDAFDAAKMDEWLFWEQYSHEPYVAVCRFQMRYLGKPASDLDPDKVKRGYTALARMEHQLGVTRFLAGEIVSLADVALLVIEFEHLAALGKKP